MPWPPGRCGPGQIFEVTPPNHVGYVQFPAILLLIFAAMFFQVAKDPNANRFIMLYGVALKAGYCGLVVLRHVHQWGSWHVDPLGLGFLVVFLVCWNAMGRLDQAREA